MSDGTRPFSIYEMVTQRIVAKLEAGVVPWRRPWGDYGAPRNLASGRAYRGINPFILLCSGFESPFWMTFNQAKARGGSVRKGERATPVIFWRMRDIRETDEAGEVSVRRVPILRYFSAFNVAQCEGIDAPALGRNERPFEPIAECERIVADMPNPPAIQHKEPQAYYMPALDRVNMPARESFDNESAYYATLYHELAHSTGHESRLNRRGSDVTRHFGSADYAQEELVAEMGAAFLCGAAGIENATIDNSAAYLDGWIQRLKGDAKLAVVAAAQAQKAADYILGRSAADESSAVESTETESD